MSIADFWKSPDRIKLLDALDAGIQHRACHICWEIENAGGVSLRMRENERLDGVTLNKHTLPKTIDLNLSHTCNIKCRTCSSLSSSSWAAEDKDLPDYGNQNPRILAILTDRRRITDNDLIQIRNIMTDVTVINAYGGEPMLVKELWVLLEMFSDEELKKMTFHMNTNGTIFNEKKLSVLQKFKEVIINVSIDGIGTQFEYLRHPAKWNEVEENLNKFLLVSAQNQWQLDVCITVSAFNIYYLPEIIGYFEMRQISYYLNVAHDPSLLSLSVFPDNVREQIHNRLAKALNEKIATHPHYVDQVRTIMSLLQSAKFVKEDLDKFLVNTKAHDDYRNESCNAVFPELFEMLSRSHT